MTARVLVTGGAGFIGSHTVDLLLREGYEVRILDSLQPRVHPRGRPAYVPADVEFVHGDVTSPEVLDRALAGMDSVLHLAAYQDYLPDFSSFVHVNAESAALLFELIVARSHRVGKIVFASSQAVAGEGRYRCDEHGVVVPDPRPLEQLERDDWELHCPSCGVPMTPLLIDEATSSPHTAYGISKRAVELLAKSLGGRYGIATACMRYTYVQGARNSFFNAYSGICRRFALRILHGLPPVCYEDGQQLRDYVNVADVAMANLLALRDPGQGHAIYNVGGGTALTVLQFARLMLDACRSSLEPSVPGEFRVGDTRHTVSNVLAMRRLGWEPRIPVQQSIAEFLDWLEHFQGTAEYLAEAERVMRSHNVVRSVAVGAS
ncbi:MAG TPA: NAD-dependent epimerase/dehydratase family protein [Candidatus Dormibacteraeota bacterium]